MDAAHHVRPARREDLPALMALVAQPDMDGALLLPADDGARAFDRIAGTPGHTVFVAVEGDEVVGTFALVVVQHLSHGGGRSAVVEDVVVRTDRQGRGIGRALLRAAADEARRAGCYKLALSSGLHRIGAHAFYERIGLARHGVSFRLDLASDVPPAP